MYPLSGTTDLSRAFADGNCRDCGAKIPPMGANSRCEDCDDKFSEYTDSGWGLDTLVAERDQNQRLGLCFYCGNGLKNLSEWLCTDCQIQSENGQWCRSQYRRGGLSLPDRNPYASVWENNDVDNAVHLAITYNVIAQRLLSKAKYYQGQSKRGGPIGRRYLADARICITSAFKMLECEKELRKGSR